MPTLAQKYPEMWELFNKLWGKAKDNPDYDKSEWTSLDLFIVDALVQERFILNERTTVTEAWLLSRGFAQVPSDMGPNYSDHFEIAAKHGVLNIWQFNDSQWLFNDADWHQMETRIDVRRLCLALGVELKDPEQEKE